MSIDRGHLAQALIALVGIWLMAAPDVLGHGAPLAHSDHIAGPLLVTIGGISIWELNREARFAAIPVGVWLLVAPWLLGAGAAGTVNGMIAGVTSIALAFLRGQPSQAFGGGWSALWTSPSPYRDQPGGPPGKQIEEGRQ